MAWTEEQKRAASERAKARWASIKPQTKTQGATSPEQTKSEQTNSSAVEFDGFEAPANPIMAEQQDPMSGPQPGQVPNIQQADVGDIQRMVEEMVEARLRSMAPQQPLGFNPWAAPQGLHIGPSGSLVGTRDKYILDPKRYPNPCSRLAAEPMLKRFAFNENYELNFQVTVSQYQTKDGVNTREPKFTLELYRIMYDDDTGLPTNKRYTICRAIFHEDPEAALAIAGEQGYEVSDYAEKDFLDEMRYIRMRDWLREAFYPPRPGASVRKKEMVIGNKVVEVFEINSEQSATIPFDKLDKNKKL